jgi:predicted nucleotidyltransferase component of viral defense system
MKPLHTRILEARKRMGIPWEILERDYLLSWILAGISQIDSLSGTLVFKGGTALKKCYFGEYRFSEDLDFSGVGDVPTSEVLELAVRDACTAATQLLDQFAPVEIRSERYREKQSHPGGQEAFTIRAQLPWQKQPYTRVKIEISMDEQLLKPPETRKIIHDYGEPLDVLIQVYALEEIVAEKLRAILQHQAKLKERGWARSRARDYYDLWRITHTFGNQIERSEFGSLLQAKCSIKNVAFTDAGDFFQESLLAHVEKTWDQWLGPLVPDLAPFDTVIAELRPQIASLLLSFEKKS